MRLNILRNVVRDVMVAKAYLKSYRRVSGWKWVQGLENDRLRFGVTSLFSSTFAAILGPIFLVPLDVAKTKTFCEFGPSSKSLYTKTFRSFRNIMLKDSVAGLYRGYLYSAFYSLVHSTSIISLSHYLALGPSIDFQQFFLLNTIVSTLVYPLDTIM